MNLEIETTGIYFKNLEAKTRYVFNEGGTRSSKTYSIGQTIYTLAAQDVAPTINSIVSETMPHLRKGVMRDFFHFLKTNNLYFEKDHNKSDNIYQVNKSIIEFFSVDTPGKVHGPERDRLFVNELQYIDYDTFFHLAQRTRKQIFSDWNPVSEFWVYEQYINNPQYNGDITVIHSTLTDNPFLAEEIKKDIYRRAERDPNYRRVYLEGLIGQLEGVIYPNWSYGEFDNSLPFGFGLDFGFHPDPDAMVKIAIDEKNRKIYAKECFYLNNLQISDLKSQVKTFARPRDLIIADSADPRMISELRNSQLNIKGVIKAEGSVIEGIRLVQDYDIITDKESINLVKELRNHTWNDKKAGIPNKGWNHLLSGIRYYAQSTTARRQTHQQWY
ncbi:MAG: PBSX family phage terminase large subunit [Bacteroidales bacterium]|nr:PBSX family phage terminase large subunit [Bacteroidales bacterium]